MLGQAALSSSNLILNRIAGMFALLFPIIVNWICGLYSFISSSTLSLVQSQDKASPRFLTMYYYFANFSVWYCSLKFWSILFMRASALWPHLILLTSQRSHLLISSGWGDRISQIERHVKVVLVNGSHEWSALEFIDLVHAGNERVLIWGYQAHRRCHCQISTAAVKRTLVSFHHPLKIHLWRS